MHQVGIRRAAAGSARLFRLDAVDARGLAAPSGGGAGSRCSGAAARSRPPRHRPVRRAAPGSPCSRATVWRTRSGIEPAAARVEPDRQRLVGAADQAFPPGSAAGCRPRCSRCPPAPAGSRPCRRRTARSPRRPASASSERPRHLRDAAGAQSSASADPCRRRGERAGRCVTSGKPSACARRLRQPRLPRAEPRSTASASGTGATKGRRTMPSPRTSSRPAKARGGRACPSVDLDPVVGDQVEAMVQQPEQQVGLARTGRADQQHAMPVAGGAACMDLHAGTLLWAGLAANGSGL